MIHTAMFGAADDLAAGCGASPKCDSTEVFRAADDLVVSCLRGGLPKRTVRNRKRKNRKKPR